MQNNQKKILITGATGFIGYHLLKRLVNDKYECRVLVRKTSKAEELKKLKRIEFVYADLTDKNSLKNVCNDINLVFHLAAIVGQPGVSDEQFYRANVEGTRNLLEVAYDSDVEQFIFCSTPGVQGKGYRTATEDLPYNPQYTYEKTKAEAEKIVLQYDRKRPNFSVTIFRPDFVYGPGDMRRLPLYKMIQNRKFFIIDKGETVLHPTYIDDVVQGMCLAINNHKAYGNVFNIAGPEILTVKEYVQTIARILGVEVPKLRIPKLIAIMGAKISKIFYQIIRKEPKISLSKIEFVTKDHGCDITKAIKQLQYSPKVKFYDGMAETLNWCFLSNYLRGNPNLKKEVKI